MNSVISLDSVSWATSISRTHLTSDAGFGLRGVADVDAVSDLQDILNVTRQLQIPVVPHRELLKLESVGEGVNFSVVKHLWGDKIVALKYVKTLATGEDKDVFRKRLRSALRELMVMHHKPLAAHPNIVKLLGCGWQQTEGRPSPFIAVELGSLGSLRHFLRSRKSLVLQKKLLIAGDVAAGLMALHQAGVVHGDLKLDNIVCFQTWSRQGACLAKLCDFSHSIAVSGASKNVYYYGTPRYLPPEAVNQHQRPITVDDVHKCDIWAFGLTLWEILLDGQIYMQSKWLHDPLYARSGAADQSCASSWVRVSAADSESVFVSAESTQDQSQIGSIFGDFDPAHLSTFACEAVDSVTLGTASTTASTSGFARAYLRPLMRRTLDPNPQNRFSNIARWPIITNWQATSCYMALESQLAFHTLKSHLSIDMFLPDRQNDIAWSTQIHIYDDIGKVITTGQQGPFLSEVSIQLALCKAFGFGCDINFQQSGRLLEESLQYDTAFADFVGRQLADCLTGNTRTQPQLFADRVAAALTLKWNINHQSEITLRARRSGPSQSSDEKVKAEDVRFGYMPNLQQLLSQAKSRLHSTVETILSRYLICLDKEEAELNWLELAVLRNDHSFVDFHWKALSTGEDLGAPGSSESSPLLLACGRGQAAMVRQLLRLGANPTAITTGNSNLLHYLICLKDQAVNILHEAMRTHAHLQDLIDSPCEKVLTVHAQWPLEITGSPLAIAVTAGHMALVQALLDYGACAWMPAFASAQQDQDFLWTPMHLAIKHNFSDIVALFMHPPGGRPFEQMYIGDFPLGSALSFLTAVERYAIHGASSDIALTKTVDLIPHASLSKSNAKGMTPLLRAMDFENFEVVKALLRQLPSLSLQRIPNPADAQEFTLPLHFACQIGARKDVNYVLRIPKVIVEMCPEALDQRDNSERSALHLAVTSEYSVIAEWLLDKSLDINGRDGLNRTALMLCQSSRTAELLIKRGANINLRDRDGMTAAHFAVSRGNHEVLRTLIRHGVDVNFTSSKSGRTLLHDATDSASLECIQVLCHMGASVNVQDRQGRTPLHLAMTTTSDIVRVLVDRGSDIVAADDSGRTPMRIAVERFSDVTNRLSDGPKIFESLIQPLCESIKSEERNSRVLAQLLNTIATDGTAGSVAAFLTSLSRRSQITVNTAWLGRRPLHAAASTANLDVVRALFASGTVDINATDNNGRTALMLLSTSKSREYNIPELFDFLVARGAHMDTRNSKGESAWTLALDHKSFKMLTYLLSKAETQPCLSIVMDNPLFQDDLVAAIDAHNKRLIEVFSRWLQTYSVPTTYSSELRKLLAKALMCQEQWRAIGKRLGYVCMYEPRHLRATLMGNRVPLELGYNFYHFDDKCSIMSDELISILSEGREQKKLEQRQRIQRMLQERRHERRMLEQTQKVQRTLGETPPAAIPPEDTPTVDQLAEESTLDETPQEDIIFEGTPIEEAPLIIRQPTIPEN